MAEQTSREAARMASTSAGGKAMGTASAVLRTSSITAPATVAWAQNDTCGNRDRIPKGAKLLGAFVSNGALGASVTCDVGLRAWTKDGTGTALDADGIVAALAVASAQSTFGASGALVAGGAEYSVTDRELRHQRWHGGFGRADFHHPRDSSQ